MSCRLVEEPLEILQTGQYRNYTPFGKHYTSALELAASYQLPACSGICFCGVVFEQESTARGAAIPFLLESIRPKAVAPEQGVAAALVQIQTQTLVLPVA